MADDPSGLPLAPDTVKTGRLIIDAHIDVPYRLALGRAESGALTEDVSRATSGGDFDHPRAVAGGLSAAFMAIYVPVRYQIGGGARAMADGLIDIVEQLAARAPDKFALATSPAQILANAARGVISLPMGIENGAAIEADARNLEHFHRRGIRYITLTHFADNLIADSATGDGLHGGLSEFGCDVVKEMNRLGMMIDVSHASDEAFAQIVELSRAPVIASHSSLRHFTPGFKRNVSDDMLAVLRENGGVVMINFGSKFIAPAARRPVGPGGERKFATVQQVADHVMRAVDIAGIDHVGFGSDFDGVGDTLPIGLKDVAAYPNLLAVLTSRGLSASDLDKLCAENLLRVWSAVESA